MPKRPFVLASALLLFVMACAPSSHGSAPAVAAPPPAGGGSQPASPRRVDPEDALCAPLLIEPDLGFGTHVVMRHLPDAADITDLRSVSGLRQIVVALPEWPADFSVLQPLQQVILPEDAELVVLLPGWPPSGAALDAWNLLGQSVRLIMVVSGPPTDRSLITELNRVRNLERVIAQMPHPDRSGFERLQRPLSFRVVWN